MQVSASASQSSRASPKHTTEPSPSLPGPLGGSVPPCNYPSRQAIAIGGAGSAVPRPQASRPAGTTLSAQPGLRASQLIRQTATSPSWSLGLATDIPNRGYGRLGMEARIPDHVELSETWLAGLWTGGRGRVQGARRSLLSRLSLAQANGPLDRLYSRRELLAVFSAIRRAASISSAWGWISFTMPSPCASWAMIGSPVISI